MNNEQSRRQFLKNTGLGTLAASTGQHFIYQFISAVVQGFVNKAYAETTKQDPTYLFSLIRKGGIPRWTWDLFFTLDYAPDPARGEYPNIRLQNTWLANDRYNNVQGRGDSIYHVRQVPVNIDGQLKMVYLPPLWSENMPTSDGGSIKMHELLEDMMIWRGVNMVKDYQHKIGPHIAVRPFISENSDGKSDPNTHRLPSLGGLIADACDRPIDAVVLANAKQIADTQGLPSFKSAQGRKPSYSYDLYTVMQPFIGELGAQFDSPYEKQLGETAKKDAVEKAVKASLDEMKTYASRAYPGADILFRNREAAERLLRDTFKNIKQDFGARMRKYRNLCERSLTDSAPNIIPDTINHRGVGKFPEKIRHDYEGFSGFAMAEYLFEKDLCCNVEMFAESAYHMFLENGYSIYKDDEHKELNREAGTMCTSFRWRNTAAQLYEFREHMKAINKWDDTVVLISSEYERRPGAGATDHEFYGNVYTVASGRIDGPLFLGSLKKRPDMWCYGKGLTVGLRRDPSKRYAVTKGVAGANICKILRVDPPIDAPDLLGTNDEGRVISLAEWPKNV